MSVESFIIKIAKEAYSKRCELIQKFKDQGKKGNVVVDLSDGCFYTYGETIPTPVINFRSGESIDDMKLFCKIWQGDFGQENKNLFQDQVK